MKTKIVILLYLFTPISCKESNKIERENEPTIYNVKSEDEEMNAAIEKANQTLSEFN